MKLFFANAFGWAVIHWKIAIPAALVILLLFFGGFWWACSGKPAKMDEKEIREAQIAIEERNFDRLSNILANADVKEKVIQGEVANAAANTAAVKDAAKKKYDAMTNAELAAELESRK